MKYKALGCVALGVAALTLASCDFSVPKSLRVKASPTVNAAFGEATYELADYLSVDEMTDAFNGSGSDMNVYDYVDTSAAASVTAQTFLVHMPIMNVPVDFSEFVDTTSIEGQFDTQLQTQSFSIPEISVGDSGTVYLPITTMIGDKLNAGAPLTVPMIETGSLSAVSATIPDQTISMTGFDTVTFSAGSINIALSMGTVSSGYSLTVTEIALMDGATEIASSTQSVNAVTGGTVTIPLAGETLPNVITVSITATTQGGAALTPRTLTVAPSFAGCVVSEIAGFDTTVDITVPSFTAPISAGSSFVSAVIGTGTISLNPGSLPAGFTGFTRTTDMSITQTGGLSATVTGSAANPVVVDLAGQTVTGSDVTVGATVHIEAVDATITGLDGNDIPIAWSATSSITNFDTVNVLAGAGFALTQTFEQTLDASMQDTVQNIHFNQAGITLDFNNGLPVDVDNDMTIRIQSAAFGIDTGTVNVPASGDATVVPINATRSNFDFVPAAHANIDFTVTVGPQAYNAGTGELTLSNITPGETITFGGTNLAVATDWASATVAPDVSYAGNFPESGGDPIDLSIISDFLGNGLSINDVKTYLYISEIGTMALEGVIKATYTPDGASVPVTDYLVGSDGGGTDVPANINLCAAMPGFPAGDVYDINPAVDGPLPDPLDPLEGGLDLSPLMTAILNDAPADLRLSYDVTAAGITVTPTDLDGVTNLTGELVILMPIKFAVDAGGAEINLTDQMRDEGETPEDLFGRTPGEVDENMDKAFDSMTAMSLSLTITNTTGLYGEAAFTNDPAYTTAAGFTPSAFTIAAGTATQTQTLTLTRDQAQYMKNNVPFVPKITMTVPNGPGTDDDVLQLNRNGTFTLSVIATIRTEVDQTVDF